MVFVKLRWAIFLYWWLIVATSCTNIFNFQNFVNDFSAVVVDRAFEGQEKTILLNEVVCEHFMRQGMLDVADAVVEVFI